MIFAHPHKPDTDQTLPRKRLDQLAIAVRSKNAGPCLLTIDVIFSDRSGFDRAARQVARIASHVSLHYGLAPGDIRIFVFEPALAIKITFPRTVMSGGPGDRDVYGAQQHAPMLGLEL